ncbi:A designed zinc finger protein bound To Dna, partial [Paraphysoderma sedebokerense]
CSQSFTRFQNLKSHYMTHTGVRPYTCTECGLAFSRQHDLKRHERLHTGVKPYKCDICGRSFARLGTLLLLSRHYQLF